MSSRINYERIRSESPRNLGSLTALGRVRFFILITTSLLVGMGPATARLDDSASAPDEVAADLRTTHEATISEIESSNFESDFSPGEATTSPEAELDEIYAPNQGLLDRFGFNRPLDLLINPLEALYQRTGLRIGVAETMLFMQPMGGQSSRYGAAGDLDLISSWTLLGRGTSDTGRFVLTGEYRYQMGLQPPSALRGEMGTLVAPTNAFNDRGWVIRDLYWVQRLFDARIRILFGRANPSDYMGAHWLQSANTSFVNRSFSANAAIPFPGHGPMLGLSLKPTDQFYLTLGAANAYSQTIRTEIDTLFNYWDLFSFGEIGYTPTFPKLGAGRYAFGLWHMDARSLNNLPEDYGFTFIVDQNLTKDLQIFARYGYSDGTLTNIRQMGQIGLGLSGLVGRTDDLTGVAISLAIPRNPSTRNETVLEVFHRFQISQNNQLSFGLQLIANPGNAPDNQTAGVFYARIRTTF